MITVAALYVDPRGPYPSMPGVECWDEERDARNYQGPHPVVAHPPCGPWGQFKMFCKHQDASLAPLAIEQVRRWGGVLEHPRWSRIFDAFELPLPGQLPDVFGGVTLEVDQCRWGHVCRKWTWLYLIGVGLDRYPPLPPSREPTHGMANGRSMRLADGTIRKRASAEQRRRTPPAFAEFLVGLARRVQRTEAA